MFLCSEKSYSDTDKSYDPKPDVEELEMLLEAYFAQINGILQKLSTVHCFFILIVGVFGMNIHIDLYDAQPSQFWATTGGTVLGCVLLFLVSIWWGKRYLLPR